MAPHIRSILGSTMTASTAGIAEEPQEIVDRRYALLWRGGAQHHVLSRGLSNAVNCEIKWTCRSAIYQPVGESIKHSSEYPRRVVGQPGEADGRYRPWHLISTAPEAWISGFRHIGVIVRQDQVRPGVLEDHGSSLLMAERRR